MLVGLDIINETGQASDGLVWRGPHDLIINSNRIILIMNFKLEDWTSLASLGLAVMFVALLLSFYNFLIGPQGIGPERVVEPGSLLL